MFSAVLMPGPGGIFGPIFFDFTLAGQCYEDKILKGTAD